MNKKRINSHEQIWHYRYCDNLSYSLKCSPKNKESEMQHVFKKYKKYISCWITDRLHIGYIRQYMRWTMQLLNNTFLAFIKA